MNKIEKIKNKFNIGLTETYHILNLCNEDFYITCTYIKFMQARPKTRKPLSEDHLLKMAKANTHWPKLRSR